MNTLWIVMPAYNEAWNIESVVRQWYPVISRIKMAAACLSWMMEAQMLHMRY